MYIVNVVVNGLTRITCAVALVALLASCSESTSTQPGTPLDSAAFGEPARARAAVLIERLAQTPDDARTIAQLAMLAHAYGRDDMAIDLYQQSGALAPLAFEPAYLGGIVLAANGRNEEALVSLDRARAIQPAYPPLRLRLAELTLASGDVDGARVMLESLLQEQPDYAPARLAYGRLLASRSELDEAATQLQRAVDLVPHYGAAHYALAGVYQELGKQAAADAHLRLFEKNQRAAPASGDTVLAMVEDLRGSAQQAIIKAGRLSAAGKLADAAEVFATLLESDPENVVAHSNLIGLYGAQGLYDRAQFHYEAGRALAPDEASLHKNYGVLMLKQERYEDAVGAFRAATAADPDAGGAYRYLGLSLENLGDAKGAIAAYQQALQIDALDHQAGYLLGAALLARGDATAAVPVLERIVVPVSPKTPSYLRKLAQAYAAAGDTAKTLDTLSRARASASSYGQTNLVATIDSDLASINASPAKP